MVEEDIEMADLDDAGGLLHGADDTLSLNKVDEPEDNDDEQEVNAALLGSSTRTRGLERPAKLFHAQELWPQVKDIVSEVVPVLAFSTLGILFTGQLLDNISRWTAMKEVHQLIIIMPVVMNLKGNLEMNLSARLGTAANVGDLEDPSAFRSMILGHLAFLQVQGTIISFIASCIALMVSLALPHIVSSPSQATTISQNSTVVPNILLRTVENTLIPRRPIPLRPDYSKLTFETLIMVSSTAMTATCLSGIILGSFMCTLIVLCRKFDHDPDNIAPPVASFLGDLVTLCLIGVTSTLLVSVINTIIPLIIGLLVVAFALTCLGVVIRNPHVRLLLTQGWSPLFGAMVISTGTGIILDSFVRRFPGFALLAVSISGIPGAVGCILTSRLSTTLHAAALHITPISARMGRTPSIKLVMLTLVFITIPVEIIFISVCCALGWLKLPIIFLILSFAFFLIAVMISLCFAQFFTNFLWSINYDPDAYALPIHSALMDLVGQSLLALCYWIVQAVFNNIT